VPVVDLLHLAIVAVGLAIGAWSLIALRSTMPIGRFAMFSIASAGALFGCAALSGEVGLLPPTAWFAIVLAMMLIAPLAARRLAQIQIDEG
jgi:hypothetical protein